MKVYAVFDTNIIVSALISRRSEFLKLIGKL